MTKFSVRFAVNLRYRRYLRSRILLRLAKIKSYSSFGENTGSHWNSVGGSNS